MRQSIAEKELCLVIFGINVLNIGDAVWDRDMRIMSVWLGK